MKLLKVDAVGLMKAPLLLSADLPKLAPSVLAIINNSAVIAVNQLRTSPSVLWWYPIVTSVKAELKTNRNYESSVYGFHF